MLSLYKTVVNTAFILCAPLPRLSSLVSFFIVVGDVALYKKGSVDGGRHTRFRHGTHEVRTQGHSDGERAMHTGQRTPFDA